MNLANSGFPIVYITGFGPFDCRDVNASQKVVEKLNVENFRQDLGVELHKEILDVDYFLVLKQVPLKWKSLRPRLVIHIGESHTLKGTIQLERQSCNQNYVKEDIKKCAPKSNICLLDSPQVLQTGLDLPKAIEEASRGSSIQYLVSMDPGTYLCGYIYYLSLSICSKRSLFIHIPLLQNVWRSPEEAEGKSEEDAVSFIAEAVYAVVKCLYKQIENCDTEDIQLDCVTCRIP